MRLNKFFGKRMTDVLKLFLENEKMLFSAYEISETLGLKHKTHRANTGKMLYCLQKIGLIKVTRTSRTEIGSFFKVEKKMVIDNNPHRVKNFYGLDQKNPLCNSFREVIVIVQYTKDYDPIQKKDEEEN